MAGKGLRWRKWDVAIHRDVGYFVVALTLIYAISGIAVNHTHQWNPTYKFERSHERFAPLPISDEATLTAQLVAALDLPGPPKDAFRRTPEQIELYYDGWSVEADIAAGTAVLDRPKERPILGPMNYLHLNRAKGWWTWLADLYALALITLVITGAIMRKGRSGLRGRGKWIIAAGLVLPIVFLFL